MAQESGDPCDLLDGNLDDVNDHANLPPLVFHPSTYSASESMFLDSFRTLPPPSFLEEDNDCFFPIEIVNLPEGLDSSSSPPPLRPSSPPPLRPSKEEVKSTISRKRSSSDLASQALESSMSLLSMVSSSASPSASPNSTSRRLGEVQTTLAKKRSSSDLVSQALLETSLSHSSSTTLPSTSSPSSRPSSPSRPLRPSLRPSRASSRAGSPVLDPSTVQSRASGPPLSSHARTSSLSSSRSASRSCSCASIRGSSSQSRSPSPSSCHSPRRTSRSPSLSPKDYNSSPTISSSAAAASAAAAVAAAVASFSGSSASSTGRPRSLSITGTSFSYSFPVSPTASYYSVKDSDDEGGPESSAALVAAIKNEKQPSAASVASSIHRSISLPSLSASTSAASSHRMSPQLVATRPSVVPKSTTALSFSPLVNSPCEPISPQTWPESEALSDAMASLLASPDRSESITASPSSLIKSEDARGGTGGVSSSMKSHPSPFPVKESIVVKKEDPVDSVKSAFDSFSPASPVNFSDDVFLNESSDWNLDALTLTSGGLSPLPHDDHGSTPTRNFVADPIFSSPSQLIMSHPAAKNNSLSPLPLEDAEPDLYHLSSLSLSTPFEPAAARNMYPPRHIGSSKPSAPASISAAAAAAVAASISASHPMSSDLSLSSLSEVLSSFSTLAPLADFQASLSDEVGPLPCDVDDGRDWDPKSQNSSYYSSDSSMNGRHDTDDDFYPMKIPHMLPESNSNNGSVEVKDEGFRKRKVSIEGPRASCHQCKTSLSLQELVQCTVGHEEHRRRTSSLSKKGDKSDPSRGWMGANPFVWNNKTFSAETKASVQQANASPPLSPKPDPLGKLPDIKKLKFMLREQSIANAANNPPINNPMRAKSGRCRKKYCLRCFSEYLSVCSFEQSPAGLLTKSCPACALVCHCAACGRKMGVVQPPPTRISCHQCKHQSSPTGSLCCTRVKDKANPRGCRKKFCSRCLLGYKIVANQVAAETWLCPACIGICECSNCRSDRASPSMFSVPDLPTEKGKGNPRRGRESNQQDFVVTNRKKAR